MNSSTAVPANDALSLGFLFALHPQSLRHIYIDTDSWTQFLTPIIGFSWPRLSPFIDPDYFQRKHSDFRLRFSTVILCVTLLSLVLAGYLRYAG